MGQLEGKKAIITGGARGFGYEIASEFIRQGADVSICSRNEKELEEALSRLLPLRTSDSRKVLTMRSDVSKASDIDKLFEFSAAELGGIDILVHNAGIQGPIGEFETNNWDEMLEVINVNLLGTLYCMRKAVEVFKQEHKGQASDKSIVNISGGGATGARPYFMGYAVAKTGVVRATETLAKETAPYGIRVNAIAPGAMNTKMLDDILAAGEASGEEYQKSLRQKEGGGASMKNAAELAVYLASDKAAGITGRLISAVWDGWKDFDEHVSDIEGSDVYTLRRIIPKDRGFDWE